MKSGKEKLKCIKVPTIVIAAGFATETQIFKALAMDAPYVKYIAIAKDPITA